MTSLMSRNFCENTRVQVPAAYHLCRLGYKYYDRIAEEDFDARTNILVDKCAAALMRLNPGMIDSEARTKVAELTALAAALGELKMENGKWKMEND